MWCGGYHRIKKYNKMSHEKNSLQIGSVVLPSRVMLAPLAGVTDRAFRKICRRYFSGLMVTEMVSISGLYYQDKKTPLLMEIDPALAPVALQIFTKDPEKISAVGMRLQKNPASIIDINMGCPAPKIVKNGEGSALMKDLSTAAKVVEATVRAVEKPVTVKCRLGWDEHSINIVSFAKMCEDHGAAAITVHGRTRNQFYEGRADWELIAQCKRSVSIPVIGNGDIRSPEQAVLYMQQSGVDGIMIGRGSMGNPWLLQQVEQVMAGEQLTSLDQEEKMSTMRLHFEFLVREKGAHIAVLEMRKHAAWYMKGMTNASKWKHAIQQAQTEQDVYNIFEQLEEHSIDEIR